MQRPRCLVVSTVLLVLTAALGDAAVTTTTSHGPLGNSLDATVAVGDLISALIATELPGDMGWHPANPASANGSLDPHGLPAFTNDSGESGLAGLLNDFPGVGAATKLVRYDLAGPEDIGEIRILTGNDGRDGRVFSTTVVRQSNDHGASYSLLGYFQSDPSGTVNTGQWGSTSVSILDDTHPNVAPIGSGITNLIFEFYAVDNTGGQMRDPYDGVNAYTGADDGLTAAFVSPLVWEIDVLATVPEPIGGVILIPLIGIGMTFLRRRR